MNVAFLIFNRPEKTARVFEAIRKARPEKLLIVADGPRNEREASKCQEVRRIAENVDWPCQVFKNYAEHNLGCKVRVSSGIDWVFQTVEEAIILEDDCLPDPSFFTFCSELLEKYRNDERIMQISGYTFAVRDPNFHCDSSYYFSEMGSINGWASWRRAWNYYDVNVSRWPFIKASGMLLHTLGDPAVVNHYNHLFDQYYKRTVDSWDSPWYLTRWSQHGLTLQPKTNLVVNIGFDNEPAHKAFDPSDPRAHVPMVPMLFPMQHPSEMLVYADADAFVIKYCFGINQTFGQRARWFLKYHAPWLHKTLKRLISF